MPPLFLVPVANMLYIKSSPLVLVTSLLLTACGGESPEENAADAASEPVAAEPVSEESPPVTQPAAAEQALSVQDIDRWQQGMQGEMQAVQEAAAKLAEAKDDNAKMEAVFGSTEMSTVEAGAKAAGVSVDEYRRIRSTFSNAVGQLSPLEMEMDVSQMPPQMVEQFKQAREASAAQIAQELPADVFEALKARAAELRELDKRLVGERLKVAQAAR